MKKLIFTFVLSLFIQLVNAQVVINEVMHKPGTSTSVNQGLRKKEYVEIYNKGCSAIDISCWIVGSGAPLTGTTPYWVGAFQFPAGTIINPGQHLVVGGTLSDNNSAYNPNDIDFDINTNFTNFCQAGSGGWLLPNGDGCVALYNSSGIVEDAIYWSSAQNPNLTTDNDFSVGPCVPITSCGGITSLMSCREIAQNYPSKLSYGGLSTSFDKTFSRVPDGGNWTRDVNPSIAGNNQCNNGQCSSAAAFQINASITQPACNSNNGSISINVSPAGNYTYNWNPNVSTNNTSTGLAQGTYSISISAGGCSKDTVISLTTGSSPNNIVVNSTNPSCNLSNGSITLGAVTGGVAPYQYNFNSSGFTSTSNYSGLNPGSFTLVIKDANGCEYIAPSITLTNSAGPTSTNINFVNPSCGQNNGSVTISSVIGGTSPFQYDFNSLGFSSNTNFSNLAPGNYSVIVKDANGCTYNSPLIVLANSNGPTSVLVNASNPTCNNNNGSVSINNVVGGVAPYEYNFNASGFNIINSFTGLASGNYSLIVKDATGCIYNAPPITLTNSGSPVAINLIQTPSYCDKADGSLQITGTIGGTAPYQYSLNNQGFTNVSSYTNLVAGTYSLSVVDINNCVYNRTVVLNNTTISMTISSEIVEPSCEGMDGMFKVTNVTGGSAPYQYSFNDGVAVSVPRFENLSSGNFPFVVIDGDGCKTTFNIDIPKTDDEAVFYAPNAFTPNDDDVNDKWFIETNCISEYKCYIYNRWGETIAVLDDITKKWDGTYKNNLVQDGVYVYVIYAIDFQNKSIVDYGQISVLK